MNVFFLDTDPIVAARLHCDKHVGKMLVESAQMLSTGLALAGHPVGYKPAYVNHPMTIWVRRSAENFAWTWCLARALATEFRFRYGRTHKTATVLPPMLLTPPWRVLFGAHGLTPVPLCMPDAYQVPDDPVASYRRFYRGAKAHFASYTRRPVPDFLRQEEPPAEP